MQIPPLFQRYVRAPLTARSQAKLDKCWTPPPHFIGELHAHLLKTFAMPLVYGPLYPLLYPVGAAALVYAFAMCRFALSYWWARPPQIDDELLQRLRGAIALCLWLHFAVALGASCLVNIQSAWGAIGRTIACVVLWLFYAFAPFERLPMFRRYRPEQLAENSEGEKVLFYHEHAVERYECPTLGGPNKERAAELEKRFNRDVRGWTMCINESTVWFRPTTRPEAPARAARQDSGHPAPRLAPRALVCSTELHAAPAAVSQVKVESV